MHLLIWMLFSTTYIENLICAVFFHEAPKIKNFGM